ncbi:MAG: SDR family oxidoreductase [Candidatus Omnitrophica bacterium]|nr:SDR family oxidoreductase [Candidatus Omnitrophota bacterium]
MAQNLFDVAGKTVVITGGLGQLGRQFAQTLSGNDAKVAILDIGVRGEVSGDSVLYLKTDITQRRSIESALAAIEKKWGIPHALINNAALDSPPHISCEETSGVENYPEEAWNKIMDVNLKGTFLASQTIGRVMANAGRGVIVNINSIYGCVSPNPQIYEHKKKNGQAFFKPIAYSVSKSGLLNLTRYLATYWAPKNVRVNTLTFGGVSNNQDPEFVKEYSRRVPLGRMAQEHEYNGAILFLVSEASSYMTGANLILDGGWTAW